MLTRNLWRRGFAAAKRPVQTPPPNWSSEVSFYEYTGLKRLRFIRDGLLPISAYFAVKMYMGSQGMFEHVITSTRYTLVELGIMTMILGGHYSYLNKLVHSVSLDGNTQTVNIRTFNILGQPTQKVRKYNIADMSLQTDQRQNILSVVNSKEYFFLERNSRVEKLFPRSQS